MRVDQKDTSQAARDRRHQGMGANLAKEVGWEGVLVVKMRTEKESADVVTHVEAGCTPRHLLVAIEGLMTTFIDDYGGDEPGSDRIKLLEKMAEAVRLMAGIGEPSRETSGGIH